MVYLTGCVSGDGAVNDPSDEKSKSVYFVLHTTYQLNFSGEINTDKKSSISNIESPENSMYERKMSLRPQP
jgi:hypothetical protein